LAESSIVQWKYPAPTKRVTFQSQSFTEDLQSAVHAKEPRHLVPLDPNFPGIESILYDPGEVLTSIQVTIKKKHAIAVVGLKRIQGWLEQRSPLAGLWPSTAPNRWRLIFVVPTATAASFEQLFSEGDADGHKWAKKVDQYVLGITDTVWGKTATTWIISVVTNGILPNDSQVHESPLNKLVAQPFGNSIFCCSSSAEVPFCKCTSSVRDSRNISTWISTKPGWVLAVCRCS